MSVARSLGLVAAASAAEVGLAPVEQLAGRLHAFGQHARRGSMTKMCSMSGQLGAHLEEAIEEACVLEDHDLRLGVADQVGDLLGRRRVVDAHAGGPQELRGGVEPVEVGAVAHHEQHAVAGLDAVLLEAGRGTRHEVGVRRERPLLPGARLLAVHRPQGDDVAVGSDGVEEPAWARCARRPRDRSLRWMPVPSRPPWRTLEQQVSRASRRVGLRAPRRYKLDPRVNPPAVLLTPSH